MGASYVGLALLLLLSHSALSAPVAEESRDLQEQDSYPAEGCYYNFEHYEEGDRIVTNEPCLNCTCHNHMLMCYLRVCPFTKAIGQDCTVEKKPDQCCPVITCPEVPVQLLTSSTTQKPTTLSTALGRPDNYGCTLSDNTFYPDGAQVPSDPRKPCELCYCIRNRTACVMQECTLQVEGCQPVYQQGVCCPVRYDCDYDSVTTPGTTVGLITTPGGPSQCLHDGVVYNDGEMVEFKGKSPCEHCYCMRGDVVCAVQECGAPLQAPDCVPLPPPPGHCCPDTFQCANGTVPLESLLGKPEAQDDSHSSEVHSGETSHSDEPAHDSAAEGSESSEEQKKPQGEVSGSESSASSQDTQDNGDDTHTLAASDDKVTDKPTADMPNENQVLDDSVSHVGDVETETDDHQHAQTKPDFDEKIPEEHIIHSESDSKPAGDLSSESLVHDKTDNSDNLESQVAVEEGHVEGTPNEENSNKQQTTLNESNDISPDDSLQNSADNIHDDLSASIHDDSNKEKEQENNSVNEHQGEENVSTDSASGTVETSSSESDESMVTGDDVEVHKESEPDNGEKKDDQENKDSSSTDSLHVDDEAHLNEGSETPQSSDTENPSESTNDNISQEPNHPQESSELPESDIEKNRIHGVTPETYTEVSVETVEVHTSTPEINHPQDTTTPQPSLIDSSILSTEEPAITHADTQSSNESHEQVDKNEATTIVSNDASADHDVTTMLDSSNIPRLPGEGNCIIDGQTYKHNSDVHTRSACQVSCKCLNSIVHCKLVECPPPPTQYANCMPLEDHESCCPSYTCDDKPSLPLEVHSQVSTEFPEGVEQGESSHQEHDGYQVSSDHEEPSHDQAHSSSYGSEDPIEENKKPDEESNISTDTSSHDSDDSVNHNVPSKDYDETEEKPFENDVNKLDNVITNKPSSDGEGDLEKPISGGDNKESAVEVQTSDPFLGESQAPNQELETNQDVNLHDQLPQQNGEEALGNNPVLEEESSKPEEENHEQNIGIVSIEHDSNNVLANENDQKHEEHDTDSVSHSPAEIPSESEGEKHPEDHQVETTSLMDDNENNNFNLATGGESDHHDQVIMNQISNNEVIYQTQSESDHSPELHADGEITESPNTPTASQPIGSSGLNEGVNENGEGNEPYNQHESGNESSDKDVVLSQNESGASDDHPQNEIENEINHINDVPQDSSTTIQHPDHPSHEDSITDNHSSNNEEISSSDNSVTTNEAGTTAGIEEQQVDSIHGADKNLVQNEVGSEEPHQPEISENNESQTHEHDTTEPNLGSGSNEVAGIEDPSLQPDTSENETIDPSSQSSHTDNLHPAHDSLSQEEENVVNPTTNEDSDSNIPEKTDNLQEGGNISDLQNEMDKPADHESETQPQDNTITIEDGVGGIIHHDTPNEIDHQLLGVEKGSGENLDDTSIHHNEQALEETGVEHHDLSPSEGDNDQDVPEIHDSSDHNHEVSPDSSPNEHLHTVTAGEEGDTNQGEEGHHETSVSTDNIEPAISSEETITHHENQGENILDENQHISPVPTEELHDETESNEVLEGSHDLPTHSGEEGVHGIDEISEENNHETSVPVESTESHLEETDRPHEASEETSSQEASVPVHKEEEHNVIDHGSGQTVSSEDEAHQVSQASNEDTNQNQDGVSHEESVSSVEGLHDTSSSTESGVEQEHTSSMEEHSNESMSHEDNENEQVSQEETHHDIPTSSHDNDESEHVPVEEHHDTSTAQEASTDENTPSEEEHHDIPTSQEGSEIDHIPTGEEHDNTFTSQEASSGVPTPPEEEHHEIPASQEDSGVENGQEHHDKPSSQETGEVEHTQYVEEEHDGTTSQEDEHLAADGGHQDHDSPVIQEADGDEHLISADEHRPIPQEADESNNTPTGEAQNESVNTSEEQNIPTSDETEKESSFEENNPSQDHHDLSQQSEPQGDSKPEDELIDHKDQSLSEDQIHQETPDLGQGNEQLSEKPSEPSSSNVESNLDSAQPSSNSDSDEHSTEGQSENEAVHEISHHEDDVKPDLTIADHHIEDDHHNIEQDSNEGTTQEEAHPDTSGHPQVTDDHGSEMNNADNLSEHQEDAVDDNAQDEISSTPEHTHTPGSDDQLISSRPEEHAESIDQHHTEPIESTDGLQQNEQLHNNLGSQQTEASSQNNESGVEEQNENQQTGQDSTQPQDSVQDENLSSHFVTEENSPSNLGGGTDQEHPSHGSEQEDNSEPSTAFHVEQQGNPTANPADTDAIINNVYNVVHQQEVLSGVGNIKKPSVGQDVDYTSSGISDHEGAIQDNDLVDQPPHEEHTPEEGVAEHLPVEHHAENTPEEHPEENIPEEHHAENIPQEHHAENIPQEHHAENIPEEHHVESTPEEHFAENIPDDQHAENIPEEHHIEHIPDDLNVEQLPQEQHSEHIPEEDNVEHIPEEHHIGHIPDGELLGNVPEEHVEDIPVEHVEDIPVEHVEDIPVEHVEDIPVEHADNAPVVHAENIPEEHDDDITPVEHQQEHAPEENLDTDHTQEHTPSVQHASEGNESEQGLVSLSEQESPEKPSITESEPPEHTLSHIEDPASTANQAESEHAEETNKPQDEKVQVIDHKDTDQSGESHHEAEAAAIPVEESKPDSAHEEPLNPIHHTPEHQSGLEDQETLPTASGQPELSTENAFTTVMHEIFGSTNVVTPDQQVHENEFFQPGGPLFPNWSQKPNEHITTSKPHTVPHIPEDSQYPYEHEQDYEEEDSNYSPGTCRYGGKVYLSAQQIPRDDPCDFCFCFRSDIICLQQSCPPPIQHCYQENIPGFCCPRYECHVSMATMVNVTTTTTTTTTTLPPHFLAHAYKGHAKKTGCQVKGVAYRVGERIASTSGPCLECRCGADGQMKCDPTVCNPQETLLRQVMDAAVISRRRRHIMTTPYFTARRLR